MFPHIDYVKVLGNKLFILMENNEQFILRLSDLKGSAYDSIKDDISHFQLDIHWDKYNIWWDRQTDINNEQIYAIGSKLEVFDGGEKMNPLIARFYGIEARHDKKQDARYNTPTISFDYVSEPEYDVRGVYDFDGNILDSTMDETSNFHMFVSEFIKENNQELKEAFEDGEFYDGFFIGNWE